MSSPFMAVIIDCLLATDHGSKFIDAVRVEFAKIAVDRPDLVKRYDAAVSEQSAAGIERLLVTCQKILGSHEDLWIGNLRVVSPTGRFHVGNGNRSVPVFPTGTLH
jgi:hypothetical protein